MVKSAVLLLLSAVLTVSVMSCSSESPETQQLFLDAKEMYAEINAAFRLPGNSPERKEAMLNIIEQEMDRKVISNLEEYLREAPDGKYADEARTLLEEARNSMNIRMLGQLRPLMQQTGGGSAQEQLDSLRGQMESEVTDTP
jgi:hypothetical protein